MAAVGEALASSLAALSSAGASRKVVAAALAAGLRTIASLQQSRPSVELACEEDIEARLKALRVVLVAQLAASRQGRAQHSASGLVSTDANVMANAARHEFSKQFVALTPAGARQLQRGRRRPALRPAATSPSCASRAFSPPKQLGSVGALVEKVQGDSHGDGNGSRVEERRGDAGGEASLAAHLPHPGVGADGAGDDAAGPGRSGEAGPDVDEDEGALSFVTGGEDAGVTVRRNGAFEAARRKPPAVATRRSALGGSLRPRRRGEVLERGLGGGAAGGLAAVFDERAGVAPTSPSIST